jgi:hypothetical protein
VVVYNSTNICTSLKRDSKCRLLASDFPVTVFYSFYFEALEVARALREENKLRVFENKVLRRIFGPKRDEVTGEWRRLHNKELCALYYSPNINRVIISRRLKLAGHVARTGKIRPSYRVLMEKLQGRRVLERLKFRWEGNIKMDPRKVEWRVWTRSI